MEATGLLKNLCLSFSLPEKRDEYVVYVYNPARLKVGGGNGSQNRERKKTVFKKSVVKEFIKYISDKRPISRLYKELSKENK